MSRAVTPPASSGSRQRVLADRVCGIPENQSLKEANNIVARWVLEEHARWVVRLWYLLLSGGPSGRPELF